MLKTHTNTLVKFGLILGKGLSNAVTKYALINIPVYVAYFGSDNHAIPELAPSTEGAAAGHIIASVGAEITEGFMAAYAPYLNPLIRVSGNIAQAYISNKTLISGTIRGSIYEISYMENYANYFYAIAPIAEFSYSSSDYIAKNLNSNLDNIYSVAKDALNIGYIGGKVGFLVYLAVEAVYLPLVRHQIPDKNIMIAGIYLLADSNADKIVKVIENVVLPGIDIGEYVSLIAESYNVTNVEL